MRAIFLLFIASWSFANTYTFGIVPQQSAQVLAEKWTPILAYLSEQTGDTYQLKTAPDIPAFEQALINGEYDFAYMNPYHYTVFARHPGYRAFAKQANQLIRGILVTGLDSEVTSLADLNGKSLAFPSPAAFAATVIPQAVLRQQGIEFSAQYVSSHDSVYLTVSRGLFAAGGGIERTFNTTSAQARESLAILWRSPGFTPHAFAAHPAIDEATALTLQSAMLVMHDNEQGKALLAGLNFEAIAAAQDADWDDVRALDIKLLDDLLKQHALDN